MTDELAIFSAALEMHSLEERRRYLDQQCGDNAELRCRIEDLLKSHDDAGSFMDVQEATLEHSGGERTGAEIGPYKLLQVIGEGGMGVVYMAEQSEPVTRRVALKIIKPGLDTGQVIARFEAERQALAMMDHPNIAKVLDAGSTGSGRPYFVMELVKGIPISDYCDEQHFTPKERLALFAKVCHAVQHAHQKGIIHRDLKPSNVLVAEYDQQAVPKIIDFGVAKATSQKLTQKTMFTQYGQIVGTLEYMSPEQAKLNQLDIDTRSDVYSLGVLLYQLLTGTTPFERARLQSAAFEEMLRIIREEEPPKPSTRISALGKSAGKLSGYRRTNPHRLHQVVRGELDWIVMKALEKERSRRYESASSFAADVERYLRDEAVAACPPSAAYRVRKFVRRHWAAVAVAAALLLSLCLGLIGTTSGLAKARAARDDEAAAHKETVAQRALVQQNLYFAEMNMAGHAAQEQGETRRIKKLLENWIPTDSTPDYRGWEWYYLHSLSNQDLFTIDAHQASVTSVAWSPNQRQLASASEDHTVRLWDVVRKKRIRTLEGHAESVRAISWSPDGSRLASASDDQTVKVWDVTTGQLIDTLGGNQYPISSVAWSPDGRRLAASEGGIESTGGREFEMAVKVWDANTLRLEQTLTGHKSPIGAICWSPDGQRLASAGAGWLAAEDRTVRIWDVTSGQQQRDLESKTRVIAIGWSPDGQQLAWSGQHAIEIWDVDSDDEPRTPLPSATALCWCPSSTRLAVTGRTVQVFDVLSGNHISRFRTPDVETSVCWNPNGELLATGSMDGKVKVWDVNAKPNVTQFGGHNMGISDLGWSPDGKHLASASRDGEEIKIWDAMSGKRVQVLDGHSAGAISVCWNIGGERLASSGADGLVKIWDPHTGEQLDEFNGGSKRVWRVRWSPDGRLIASAEGDKVVRIWDAARKLLVHELRHRDVALGLGWSPDSGRLATAVSAPPGQVTVWDVVTGKSIVGPVSDREFLMDADWNPKGSLFAAGGTSGEIRIWDSLTNTELPSLLQTGVVGDLAWSPDGRRLATGDKNGRVRIWDAETGNEALTLVGHKGVQAVVWSPDGMRLAAGSFLSTVAENEQIKIWDARIGYELDPLPTPTESP